MRKREGETVSINWTKIETQYVAGDKSLKQLAKEKRVSYSTLSKRASEGGWVQKRKDFRANVENEALARARERGRERMDALLQATEQLLDAAVDAVKDNAQFKRWIVSEGMGEGKSETSEKTFNKADARAMKDMVFVLEKLTGMVRDAYGIRTPAQELGEELARKRIRQVEAQTTQTRTQTAKLKRESEERETGNEVTVRMLEGEEAFME